MIQNFDMQDSVIESYTELEKLRAPIFKSKSVSFYECGKLKEDVLETLLENTSLVKLDLSKMQIWEQSQDTLFAALATKAFLRKLVYPLAIRFENPSVTKYIASNTLTSLRFLETTFCDETIV